MSATLILVIPLLFGSGGGSQPGSPPQPGVKASVDWSSRPFEELLSLLPEAGEELRWNDGMRDHQEHPASAELRRRLLSGALDDQQIIAALRSARVLACPARWPAASPLAISLRPPLWLGMNGTIEVKPRFSRGKKATQMVIYGGCALGSDADRRSREYIEVGNVPAGATEVVFDIHLTARPLSYDEVPRSARTWKGSLTYPMTLVTSAEEAIEAVKDPALDRAVRESVSIQIGGNGAEPPRTALWVQLRRTPALEPFLARAACRASVEILHGDTVLDRVTVDFRYDCRPPSMASYYRDVLTEAQLRDPEFLDALTVRITGDPVAAVQDVRRSRYWSGRVQAKLRDLLEPARR